MGPGFLPKYLGAFAVFSLSLLHRFREMRRMGISARIGEEKHQRGMTILQNKRWRDVLEKNLAKGREQGVDEGFLADVYRAVHQASIRIQKDIMKK